MITIGSLVRMSATFTDSAGAAIDPSVVRFKIRLGAAGTVTTYVYGTDLQLVKDGTGLYHVDWAAGSGGTLHYRFEGAGTATAANEDKFVIDPGRF